MKELCLYLASGSPRRFEMLRRLGLEPRVLRHEVDEAALRGEDPREHARRLARAKGRYAAERLEPGAAAGVVISADTVVTIDGSILGKPAAPEDARRMLRHLRERSHEVVTAVYLRRTDDGRETDALDSTRVIFRDYDDATVEAYVATGEPMDKAGAYGIQGFGAFLTSRIEGSWSNVVGLPLEQLPAGLERIGVDPRGLFRGRLTSR